MARGYTEEQIKEIVELAGYKYYGSETRTKGKSKEKFIKVQCPNSHEIYWVRFSHFKNRNQRCPQCAKNSSISEEEIINEVKERGLELVKIEREEKVYSDKKKRNIIVITLRCSEGHEWKADYSRFKSKKSGCLMCVNKKLGEKKRLSYDDVKRHVEENGYELLSTEYNNNREKLKYRCDNGHVYEAIYNSFQQGNRCPHCNESKGEREIAKILENYNISFDVQYRFYDCKFKYTLPFDFYLSDYNCCIEFDGEQHYTSKEYFGGEEGFEKTKIRDNIKNEYCRDNNIKLIRIPYWEFDNIKNILKHELKL